MWKKTDRKLRESQVKVAPCGFVEDGLREIGGGVGGGGFDGPEDDVELRRSGWGEKVRGFAKAVVESKGGDVARFEVLRELAAGSVREELLGGPEGYG